MQNMLQQLETEDFCLISTASCRDQRTNWRNVWHAIWEFPQKFKTIISVPGLVALHSFFILQLYLVLLNITSPKTEIIIIWTFELKANTGNECPLHVLQHLDPHRGLGIYLAGSFFFFFFFYHFVVLTTQNPVRNPKNKCRETFPFRLFTEQIDNHSILFCFGAFLKIPQHVMQSCWVFTDELTHFSLCLQNEVL